VQPLKPRWEVWTATLKGSGTADLWLYNLGYAEVRATELKLSYTGTAITSMKMPWIPAPGSAPTGIAYDGQSLFVSDVSVSGLTTVNQVDPSSGDLLRSFLAPSPGGFDGRGNPSDVGSTVDRLSRSIVERLKRRFI